MLSRFFQSPIRIRELRDGPAGTQFEGFAESLFQSGYAKVTAHYHIRSAEHFISWVDSTGMPVGRLTEKSLEQFDRHLRRCRCTGYSHTNPVNVLRGARLFFTHLREAGAVSSVTIASTVLEPPMLTEFCNWMRQLRGVCDGTLYNYRIQIRKLLSRLGEEPEKFNARDLRQFVIEASQTCGWAAAKWCTTALRMFLRFLIAEGKCAAGLDGAIPVLAHWRLASLPRYLQEDEVNASLPHATQYRRLANVIVRSCFFWHGLGSLRDRYPLRPGRKAR
jgi:integrase/recombinase XerD